MTSYFDLDALRASDYGSYQIVSRAANQKSGAVYVDVSKITNIGKEYRFRLAQASLDHESARAAAARAAATPPPPVVEKPAEPQISMAEIEAEQRADLKRAADQARATNRLNEYAAVGLEDTQHNAELIKNFVNNSAAKGYWSFEIVEVAIQTLGNKLTWKPEVVEQPAPTSVEPQEVLQTLPDGTRQLPLNATNAQVGRASKEQAKDYLKRINGGKMWQPRASGSFGSRF